MRRAINPPVSRYTIPAGTEGMVSRGNNADPRPHRTKEELQFDFAYAQHGPKIPVFRIDPDWLFAVPLSSIKVAEHRVIDALLFHIEGGSELIVWVDAYGNAKYARAKRRSNTILDVEAFQEIMWAGDRGGELELVVTEVQLYRCNRPHQNGRIIDSGRAWLEQL